MSTELSKKALLGHLTESVDVSACHLAQLYLSAIVLDLSELFDVQVLVLVQSNCRGQEIKLVASVGKRHCFVGLVHRQ